MAVQSSPYDFTDWRLSVGSATAIIQAAADWEGLKTISENVYSEAQQARLSTENLIFMGGASVLAAAIILSWAPQSLRTAPSDALIRWIYASYLIEGFGSALYLYHLRFRQPSLDLLGRLLTRVDQFR